MDVIFKLLDSDDPKTEKRGLQKICEYLENGNTLSEINKSKLYKFLSKFQTSPYVLVRRWLYKSIALLNEPSYLPFLKGQLNVERDEENRTWIVAAIYKYLDNYSADKMVKSFSFNSATSLASGYFQPSLLPKKIKTVSKILDSNDTLSLKWLSLLYGNSLQSFQLDKQKLLDRITRLNLHNDEEVAEYSIWALHKSITGSFADSQISPQEFSTFPPNIRRWLYRLLTKKISDVFVYFDFIKLVTRSENDISAREGLAIGIGKFASDEQISELIQSWFSVEKNQLVRLQLLISIADNVKHNANYQQILKDEINNPYDQVSKIIALKGISSLTPNIPIQTTIDFPNMNKIEDRIFKVAFSFPGTKRDFVKQTVQELEKLIDREAIFYDEYFKSQLAKPNMDTVLQNVYHKQTTLNVVFLCRDYQEREWTGMEWRAIKDLIKQKKYDGIMLLRFDDYEIEGIFSTDGYIDLRKENPSSVAKYIRERID